MPSRLTVVLVSLLLATPAVIFWLWLVILPPRMARMCPERCRCGAGGYFVACEINTTENMPYMYPTVVWHLLFTSANIPSLENDTFTSRGLTELENIYLDLCRIETIDLEAFNGLTKLETLALSFNQIRELLPRTFEKLSRLEGLYLSWNRIENLEVDMFCGLINLKTIDLSSNKIKYVDPDMFVHLSNLNAVFLSSNPGLQIPTDSHFINSHSVSHLDISVCCISSVSAETFANVTALEWLDLSHNNLKSVDINIFKKLPKLSAMYLYDNPLQCDCQLQAVWRRCKDRNIQTAYTETGPTCDTPSEVQGIWWGVLEKGQCLQDNIRYRGDYKNTAYSYTKSPMNFKILLKRYEIPVYAVLCTFGSAGNVILLIIIIHNKDMRTVPNMYILNLAISDIIYLIAHFLEAYVPVVLSEVFYRDNIHVYVAFIRRLSVGLSAYSVAVLSIQRYRVTANPFLVHVSSQQTWRHIIGTVCAVWIVAALFAIPETMADNFGDRFYLSVMYYKQVVVFQLLVCSVLPLCVIAFSYAMTARHALKSAGPTPQDSHSPHFETRKTTARAVFGLTFVFLISSVPYHALWAYIINSEYISFELTDFLFSSSEELQYLRVVSPCLLLINSCLNPVALFCTSRAFKTKLKLYFTCRCKANSSVSNLELATIN